MNKKDTMNTVSNNFITLTCKGAPPISLTEKPMGNKIAAKQNRTTATRKIED